jgi:hypothetical protein
VTIENRANNAGAVLWIALSDRCLWVSNPPPRCPRTSWKVASICQRLTNHEMICWSLALWGRCTAQGLGGELGPGVSDQHPPQRGTAGSPVLYQTAVFETPSTERSSLPYQCL